MGLFLLILVFMIFIIVLWLELVLYLDMLFVVVGGSLFFIFNGCELFEVEFVFIIVKVVMLFVFFLFCIY